MKKLLYFVVMILMPALVVSQNLPEITLPKIEIDIEDQRDIDATVTSDERPILNFDDVPLMKPELTEAIKVDLEKTLPATIASGDKKKPIDAIIRFGYGPNNFMLADFSIFMKEFNPMISINYSRRAKDNFWIDEPDTKNYYSMDKLNSEISYNKGLFSFNSNIDYYAVNYSLQDKSVYSTLGKRVLGIDMSPYLKFSNKNDLTLLVENSFLFTDLNNGSVSDALKFQRDFDYFLQSNLIYSQIIKTDHYFSANAGYNLSYYDSREKVSDDTMLRSLFHALKLGLGYTGIFAESWFLNARIDFHADWKAGMASSEKDWVDITQIKDPFQWFVLPVLTAGYNFKEYFNCYVEGGATLIEKPASEWLEKNEYAVLPSDLTSGYRFYGKTGVKAVYAGFVSGYADIEFAYNWGGYQWQLLNDYSKLYTLGKRDYFDLLLTVGGSANYKEFVKFGVEWKHQFWDILPFEAGDTLSARLDLAMPKFGLSFFTKFSASFRRVDDLQKPMDNLYILDAGIDWNHVERFGIGAEFNNIIYYTKHQIKRYYDEPGFECVVYMKVGF